MALAVSVLGLCNKRVLLDLILYIKMVQFYGGLYEAWNA